MIDRKKAQELLNEANSRIFDAESEISDAQDAIDELQGIISRDKPSKESSDLLRGLSIADLEELRDKVDYALRLRMVS